MALHPLGLARPKRHGCCSGGTSREHRHAGATLLAIVVAPLQPIEAFCLACESPFMTSLSPSSAFLIATIMSIIFLAEVTAFAVFGMF
jgi:hypothetical protein